MLLTTRQTPHAPRDFIEASGRIFAVFDDRTQDSGNVSYGVEALEQRYFIKTPGTPGAGPPVLSHPERIELLRNVIRLHERVSHPALVPLRNVVESPDGPLLVFDWVPGELLGAPADQRSDPTTGYVRFRRLPAPAILRALDAIIDLHQELASEGYIAVDFYDGALLFDFENERIHVIDLDSYHLGPFVNRMGRLFGSTRFMAPEEFELGAEIDERTTVYTLGRAIMELFTDPASGHFRGTPSVRDVAERACARLPRERYGSVYEMAQAWRKATRSIQV